ncbi:putative lactate 2-monooxygenase [Fusarium oxysporum f. sp. rapae]|uniref:Putative lactate 2-monooxygenase n=1 Tax=Fusarium oxysporum f. sp. rapae TaxID=485398 RepID=A0A8J5TP88_FUSOX|nr:putative lactate 2-monooxygenase [Fusarium oxysporum f. sp. rapae]
MASPSADVLGYEKSIFDAGLHFARPAFTFQTSQWEPLAKQTLSATSWGYIHGNCGSGSTYRNNLTAFSRSSIVPNRLVPSRRDKNGNEQFSDTSTTVLGQKLPFPLAIAPIGVQKIFNPEGEAATARAAASLRVPYTLSTASSTSIEDVAAANGKDAPRWFQLYWPSREHDDITISMLKRAKASGYTAIFVTLDTYVLGWRPSDLDNGYNPFIHPDHIGVEIGLTDPVFQKNFKEKHGYDITDAASGVYQSAQGGSAGASLGDAAREWAKIVFPSHSHSWEDIEFLKKHWDGPIVLKGIQSVHDAKKCVEVGVQGIVVSNHGGRQQDGGASSLGMLPRIVDAVGDKLDIFFDSGIRCGADIMKALALGAKCVLVGRPYAYGLALGGEDGVRHVLRALCGDLTMNMHLAGLRDISEVNRDILVKESDLV